jgi:hypothetical protein
MLFFNHFGMKLFAKLISEKKSAIFNVWKGRHALSKKKNPNLVNQQS